MSTLQLVRISIKGVVQGVGFRPFIYQLAARHRLTGWVCNTSGDVRIEVEGGKASIDLFLSQVRTEAPPRSRIEEMSYDFAQPLGYGSFEIRKSISRDGQYQLISPDIATCSLCEEELFDPGNRRYRYPFINCTNCGPRLTIIRDIPYDRPKTTMLPFIMCPECRGEYDDPMDRRFHAQPNCCPVCGPRLELVERDGRALEAPDPLMEAVRLLRGGSIVAVKGIGGFLLACDATSGEAVETLRTRKRRPQKPFAVMMGALDDVRRHCLVSPEEEALLVSPRSPIVLLKLKDGNRSFPGVSPNLNTLGVMLPYTPLHHLLMREAGIPLIMTSGNLSEEPIVGDNAEALDKLGGIADYFLLHDRDIYALCDDSVVMVEKGLPQVIRRARGYAPHPVRLPFATREVLACGGELKNTFCMTRDEYAFISQHIGDMDNLETLTHFEKMLDLYRKLFRLDPVILAHDKHPDYFSTRFALEMRERNPDLRVIPVQHHHAHIVSCMAENRAAAPVIGVAFDGTGYGDDGAIWGGEFLLAGYGNMTRLGHLEYVPLPGGDAAIRRPYRTALSYLFFLLGKESLAGSPAPLEAMDDLERELILTQVARRINSPLTSSAGRLFDAVSALVGIRGEIDYEGQAAVELEMEAEAVGDTGEHYPFEIDDRGGERIVRLGGILSGVLGDIRNGVTGARISVRFHHTMAEVILRMCLILAGDTGIDRVALSGGVFQNRRLLGLARDHLEEAGLRVMIHREIPCNDGGISLGQALIADAVAP